METRPLGDSKLQASVIGLGTWAIGGWMWGGTDEERAIRGIHAALDSGVNLVDTAPIYGFGVSEEVVGKAIKDRRDDVLLATKCGLIWHEERGQYNFTTDEKKINSEGSTKVYRCLAPDVIRYEIEQSLRRLQTDYVDLLQTHWQEPTTSIEDTMATLMKLKEEGKIRCIGCSNATPEHMDEYRNAGQLDVDQEKYSMLDRKHEEQNLPYCAENNVAFLAYSPLAQGLLTGKIGPDRTFNEGDMRQNNPRFSVENRQRIQKMLECFKPVAANHNATLGQVAISWTIAQHGCTHALIGARDEDQAKDNAQAGEIRLTSEELNTMRKAVEEHTPEIK